jgi:hypothetical protein
MSNTSVKIALAFFVVLAWPAASFARRLGRICAARGLGGNRKCTNQRHSTGPGKMLVE